jgi:hypothetical protein
MRAFLLSCVAVVVLGGVAYFSFNSIQQPSGVAYATEGARIDPNWSWRSVVNGSANGSTIADECSLRTTWQWVFVDFGDPKGESNTCSISQ